jgi:seryl-tRNA(Sec) selenium transferase
MRSNKPRAALVLRLSKEEVATIAAALEDYKDNQWDNQEDPNSIIAAKQAERLLSRLSKVDLSDLPNPEASPG